MSIYLFLKRFSSHLSECLSRGILQRTAFASVLLLLFVAIGCGSQAEKTNTPGEKPDGKQGNNAKPKIVCTTGMVADIVRSLGGEHFEVVQLMKSGVDPHLYQTSPADLKALYSADLIVYSGLHLEANMQRVFENMPEGKAIAVAHQLEEKKNAKLIPVGESLYDPHIWMNVKLWSECVPYVREHLAKLSPQHADALQKAEVAYLKKLEELHQYCQKQIQQIPEHQRVLVTAHDAFGYFAAEYGMQVKAVQGVSTESEAGVKKVSDLVTFLTEKKISAVFVESSVNDKNMLALIEGCKVKGHPLKKGGMLYSDAMGEKGSNAEDYIGMITHNVDTIVSALKK